jgi:3-deoxy-manno-octulosonate cytidylyltransferase (CMP-KDO synthetase)
MAAARRAADFFMPAVVAVIPARYGSSRLPGKPLAPIGARPMIRWVVEGAVGSGLFDRVLVATDDERIRDAVRAFGGEAVLTRPDHPSGTDRVAEVARELSADVVVNLQGDLPCVGRSLLGAPVAAVLEDPSLPMATVSVPITERQRWLDPNVVKVVTDSAGFALYFSRAPIPARRSTMPDGEGTELGWQHVGVYVYRRDFLIRFASWPPGRLEQLEQLEQLRVLERGERLYVAKVSERVIEVDTPEDLERAARLLSPAREEPS